MLDVVLESFLLAAVCIGLLVCLILAPNIASVARSRRKIE